MATDNFRSLKGDSLFFANSLLLSLSLSYPSGVGRGYTKVHFARRVKGFSTGNLCLPDPCFNCSLHDKRVASREATRRRDWEDFPIRKIFVDKKEKGRKSATRWRRLINFSHCCRYRVVFAQPLQERRSLRVTVARRVALRVSGHTYSLILITVIARYDPEGDQALGCYALLFAFDRRSKREEERESRG